MRLLVADIGNTHIHLAVRDGARWGRDARVGRGLPYRGRFDAVLYASVRPDADRPFERAARRLGPVRKLGRDFAGPPARVRFPREVGADRLANAAGGFARARGRCVVVDLGTAVTFDVVDDDGAFVGGIIAPGMGLGARALHGACALLPAVRPRRPSRALGKDTISNIESGVYCSVRGLIREGLAALRRERARLGPVYGTGSDAPLFADLFAAVVPRLTLEGIAACWARALTSRASSR